MVNIFIYHSNTETVKFIYDVVSEYFRTVKHAFQIFASSKANEAAGYMKKNVSRENILFFDFSDYEISYKFAAYLHKYNKSATWIHIGNLESLLKTLYFKPSAFVENPKDKEKITEIIQNLDRFWQKQFTEEYFSFKCDGDRVNISYNDILYFESNAKRVIPHIITDDRNYYFAAKLSEIEETLPDYFLRCHQSYIVNMKRVKKIDLKNHAFILEDNDEVYISKRMFTEAKKKYLNFIDK